MPDGLNPKHAAGAAKLPLHLVPPTALFAESLAYYEGALKYGRNNWRATQVSATTYVAALFRHALAWLEGEDADPVTHVPHLGSVRACAGILIDAEAAGTLVDDRNLPGGAAVLAAKLAPVVEHLNRLHADKAPRHYTLADRTKPAEPPAVAAEPPADLAAKPVPVSCAQNGDAVRAARDYADELRAGRWYEIDAAPPRSVVITVRNERGFIAPYDRSRFDRAHHWPASDVSDKARSCPFNIPYK